MPRDYKHRVKSGRKSKKRTPRKKKQQFPGWVWFLGGLVAGVMVVGGFWVIDQELIPKNLAIGKSVPATVSPPAEKTLKAKPQQKRPPQFEFYSVLPEMEVEIPPEELHPSIAATKHNSGGIYQLQLGSFRKSGDAERMKASLALIGITSRIEKVSVNDKTHFRVRSGPYSRDQAYSLHEKLQDKGVTSLIIKIRKD